MSKMYVPTEEQEQRALKEYLDWKYPKVIYNFNYLPGAKLSIGTAVKAKRLGHKRAFPDCFIAKPMMGYNGLFIELKRLNARIFKKDGTYSSEHIEEQADMLYRLKGEGYAAYFVKGARNAEHLIDSYLDGALDVPAEAVAYPDRIRNK